jgi:cytochrome c oxidase subunit IV
VSEHIVPTRVYYLIFAALMVGTYLTVQAAFIDLGVFNTVVALGIACAKATLVILFFMHVKYEANWKYVLTIPASIMSVFLILALVPDVGFRNQEAIGGRNVSSERLEHMAEPSDVKAIVSAEEGH